MNTRYEFEELIKQRLKGATWNRLKNSFLGKELIAYAGVFAELVSSQYTMFLNNLAPELADYRGLAVIGFNQGVIYDILRPSTAQIVVDLNKDVKPYEASLTIGALKYYNYSYLRSKNNIQLTLYQSVKRWSSFSQNGNSDFGDYYLSGIYWMNGKKYIKLPEDTIANSVRVYIEDFEGNTIPQHLEQTPGYKNKVSLFRDTDNTLCVTLNQPEEYDSYKDVKCYFLVGTTLASKSDENGQSEGEFTDGQTVSKIKVYTVQGEKSIEEARLSLLANLSINSSISTKEQIRSCVNTFPQVNDNEPELVSTGEITVWVKPNYPSSLEDVEDYLRLYGEMAVLWKVREGIPVEAFVALESMDSNLTIDDKSEIQAKVQEFIDKNIKYNTVLSAAWLMQSVQEYISRITLSLAVRQAIGVSTYLKLPSSTLSGTIEITRDEEVVGWDSRGSIRGFVERIELKSVEDSYLIGEVLLKNSDTERLLMYKGTITEVMDSAWHLKAQTHFLVGKDFFYTIDHEGNRSLLRKYLIDMRFGTSGNSLYKDPEQYVSYQQPYTENSFIESDELVPYERRNTIAYSNYILHVEDTLNAPTELRLMSVSADGASIHTVYHDNAILAGEGRASLLFCVKKDILLYSELNGEGELYLFDKDTRGLIPVSLSEVDSLFRGVVQVSYNLSENNNLLSILTYSEGKYKTYTAYFLLTGVNALYLRVMSSITPHEFDSKRCELLSENLIATDTEIKTLAGEVQIKKGNNPLLGKAGLVDYSNGVVSLYTSYFDNSIISYKTTELNIKEKNKYPVVEEVIWK